MKLLHYSLITFLLTLAPNFISNSYADSFDLSVGRGGMGVAVDIGTPPPPVYYEEVPPPRVGFFWIPGYWYWQGNRHIWVNGGWERERPDSVFVPGRWDRRGNSWHFEPGKWESRHEGEHRGREDFRENRGRRDER